MTSEAAGSLMLMTEQTPHAECAGAAQGSDRLASLAERARAGDRAAFEELMVLTERRVAATAWRLLGDREDARDAAQETYLRAYKYLAGFRPGHDFHGWLYRITVNVCRDMLRARRAEPVDETPLESLTDGQEAAALHWGGVAGPDAEASALLAQRRAIVRLALARLPEKERTAVVLRDLEGRTTEEVAQLMKTRPATVRSQVSTARVKLRAFCEGLLRERRRGGEEG